MFASMTKMHLNTCNSRNKQMIFMTKSNGRIRVNFVNAQIHLDPQESSTWRSGVRSAMCAASQSPGKGPQIWMMAVN